MLCHGIPVSIQHIPELDSRFLPMGLFNRAYLSTASVPVRLALQRPDGMTAAVSTFVHAPFADVDAFYIDRLVKTLLWMKGGNVIYTDSPAVAAYLRSIYCSGGTREFDRDFMSQIFENPFAIVLTDNVPPEKQQPRSIGGHLHGCRIGFDAGGSDRKVSAVMDGETVYSEEVVWFPKEHADPQYHYDGIVSALRSAAAHLPRVDAVGVSSAGVYINDRTMSASLFRRVAQADYDRYIKDIYIRAIQDTFGDIPYCVINDGDVTALAGAAGVQDTSVLGIAMGTSEAGGFVDEQGCITGWLNELAFVPVDAAADAPVDEWSGDIGCGSSYFSQDAVIRLAQRSGIELPPSLSPAQKLQAVQELMERNDPRSASVYRTIGVYLGHSLAFYHQLYHCRHVLLLGRAMSGKGGELILQECRKVLQEEYSEVWQTMEVSLPDESFRRVGQSMAAAGLPLV